PRVADPVPARAAGPVRPVVSQHRHPAGSRPERAPAGAGHRLGLLAVDPGPDAALAPGGRSDRRDVDAAGPDGPGAQDLGVGQRTGRGLLAGREAAPGRAVRLLLRIAGG